MTNRVLVVLDIDSTLINEEGLDLVASEAGPDIARSVAAITDRAMLGELDFAQSLTERVALLKGKPAIILERVSSALTLTTGAQALIDAVHSTGGIVCAVSGGFHELIDDLARQVGLDHWLANRFDIADGQLTGRVAGPIVDADAKAEFLTTWATHYSIPRSHTIAVGDGANDVAMFGAAGVSVSFCGKPIANREAMVCVEERNLARVLDFVPTSA